LNHTSQAFLTKLKRLEQQLVIARLADFSYPDAQEALDVLRFKLQRRRAQIEESESFSAATRTAILRETTYLISRITAILGIITRSASVRNAFEFYAPFLGICKALVGNDARLILSSEWEYVPFTYPQSLAELPQFIVIGLPASESDNALIFPVAGHELGHSVWAKHELAYQFKVRFEDRVNEAFKRNRPLLENTFAGLAGADLEQDMFVQHIKSSVFLSLLSQAEETFSDFMGLILFGESYMFAFEYLIAPQMTGGRAKEYPDTHERAMTLERYARDKIGVDISNYAEAFSANTPFRLPHENFICVIADEVLRELHDDIFARTQGIISAAAISLPSLLGTEEAEKAFGRGVPYDGSIVLGDLINAGWRVVRGGDQMIHSKQGRNLIDYISDLILKSAEVQEIRRIVN
jgi:hypothetical protein